MAIAPIPGARPGSSALRQVARRQPLRPRRAQPRPIRRAAPRSPRRAIAIRPPRPRFLTGVARDAALSRFPPAAAGPGISNRTVARQFAPVRTLKPPRPIAKLLTPHASPRRQPLRPPPPPECGGECRYLGWATSDCNGVELVSDWILLSDGCLDFPGVPCFCVRPSDPPTACGQVSVPCQSPTTTPAPTTTPDPGPCADCYTTTITSTSSTTAGPTTTPDPCDGYCLFRSTGGEDPTWNKIADPCDPGLPLRRAGLSPGSETCEIVQSPCGTETTTTEEPTTTSTTTSTSTSTTTTECPPNPECLGDDFACAIRCQNGQWEPILDHGRVCEGCCTCWGECATDPSGNCEPEPRVEGEPCPWPNGFLHGGFCFETATQFDAANPVFCVVECQSGNWVEIFNRTVAPCGTCSTPSGPCIGANEGERRFTCCECPTTTTEEPTTSTTSTTTEEPVGICCFQECIEGEVPVPRECQDLTEAECASTIICGQSGSWSEGSCSDEPAPCAIWCNVVVEPLGYCLDPMDPRFCQDTYFGPSANCGGPYYTQAECEEDCFSTTTEEPTTSTTSTSTTSTSTSTTSTSTSTSTTSTSTSTTTTLPP